MKGTLGLKELLGGMNEAAPRFSTPLPPDEIFYLYGAIGDPIEYVDMIHTIQLAVEDTIVVLRINSEGGSLAACLAIVNAIKRSRATILTIIDGEACSAAAMIWLAGHQRAIASEHVFFMVHQAGWGMQGKTSEHDTQVKIMSKVVNAMITDLAPTLLTASEWSDFNKGIDVYLHGSDLLSRMTELQEPAPEETPATE